MTWRAAGAIAAAALVVLVAVISLRGATPKGNDRGPAPVRIDWPAGKEQVYALSWTTSTETTGMGAMSSAGDVRDVRDGRDARAALRSQVELVGELVLASYGRAGAGADAGYVLTARFDHLARASVRAFDQALLPSLDVARGELEGRTAELTVTPSGDVTDVRFHAKDPALFRYLMQAVLTELAVDLRDGAAWKAEIDGPSGHGPVRFARDGSEPRVVTRTRERYDALTAWPLADDPLDQSLESKGRVTLEPSGVLGEVTDEERLEAARPGAKKDVVSKTSFTLTKRSERAFDASKPPEGIAEPMIAAGAASETPAQHRARLEQRTEGVTLASIVDEIRIHAAVPRGKSGRWAWIAEGYFELHPEKTEELVDAMRALDINAKAYAVDVLVMVGHEKAQAAARRAFVEKIILPGVEYALMVQRLQHLNHPAQETADFVAASYAAAKARRDTPARYASAVALGGIVHHLAESDRIAARKLDDALVLDLYAARIPRDREVLLLALGNAALEEDSLAIRLSAHDESPSVRAAVASALRRFEGPPVRATLLELFMDGHDAVQREAIASLDRRELGPDELARILAGVESGRPSRSNAQAFVNFLAKRRDAGPQIDAMLDRLLERQDLDGETIGRIARIRTRGA